MLISITPPISWRDCVRSSFWSCCFCNLISFSSLAFSTLSILYRRRFSLLFFYFLILPCLLYLAILIRFSISDFDFWSRQAPLFLLLNIITSHTAISEIVGFCVCFWSYYAKSLSGNKFLVRQFCKSDIVSLLREKYFLTVNWSLNRVFIMANQVQQINSRHSSVKLPKIVFFVT